MAFEITTFMEVCKNYKSMPDCVFNNEACSTELGRRIMGRNLCQTHTEKLFEEKPEDIIEWFPD